MNLYSPPLGLPIGQCVPLTGLDWSGSPVVAWKTMLALFWTHLRK